MNNLISPNFSDEDIRTSMGNIHKLGINFYDFEVKSKISKILNLDYKVKNIEEVESKIEKEYDNHMNLGNYKEALEICKIIIQYEIEKEYEKFGIESDIDSISTINGLKWKRKINEVIEKLYFKYKIEKNTTKAIDFCKMIIEGEIQKELKKLMQNNEYNFGKRPNFDNINTDKALKWKNRIEENLEEAYIRYVEEGNIQKAIFLCKSIIEGEIQKEIKKLNLGNEYDYSKLPNVNTISTFKALKWKERIEKLKQ